MKVLILFICGALFLMVEAEPTFDSKLSEIKTKCLNESGAEPGVVKKLIGKAVLPEGTAEKCFLTCVYKGFGVVAPNDTFVPERVKEIAKKVWYGQVMKITMRIADACSTEIKADPAEECSIGESFRACFVKKGLEWGFFPYM